MCLSSADGVLFYTQPITGACWNRKRNVLKDAKDAVKWMENLIFWHIGYLQLLSSEKYICYELSDGAQLFLIVS